MKHTMKLLAALLILTMIASLAGCSSNQQSTPNADAPAVTDAANKDAAATSADNSDKFDLSVFRFDSCEPFSEGLAWIKNGNSVSVINQQGEVIYTSDSKAPGTPFQDGLSYFKYDGHQRIIDKEGNLLYETKLDDDIYETIVGYGHGMFILQRDYHSFDKKESVLVAVDQNGKDVSPEGQNPKDKASGNTIDLSKEDLLYLCNDLFLICTNSIGVVFNAADGSATYMTTFFSGEDFEGGGMILPFFSDPVEGKLWAIDAEFYYDFLAKSVTEITTGTRIRIANGSLAYGEDGKFYDFNGVSDMPSLTVTANAKAVDFSDFSEGGYAWIRLQGQDGDNYFTFIDRQGKEQFAPKRTKDTEFYTDSYAVCDKNTVTVYDYTGAEKASVTAPQIKDIKALGENYFISNNQYFFF